MKFFYWNAISLKCNGYSSPDHFFENNFLNAFSCIERRKELWHFSAAPVVVTQIVVTFCLHMKTNLSSNIKGAGLKGNHYLLVQKVIELIRL